MKRRALGDQAWFWTPDGKGILVCLQTGRIRSTIMRDGGGWITRIFVSPSRLLELWRHGLIRALHLTPKISRAGFCLIKKSIDHRAICQDAEICSTDDI